MILKGEHALFNHISVLIIHILCVYFVSGCYLCSTDQENLDKEINDLRKRLKAKVNRLNELQGRVVLPS